MRIPESTWYKEGQTRVEDIPGYALCTQCRYCAMSRLGEIEDDGLWYCFHLKQWKEGGDILTYRCDGFEIKDCRHCMNQDTKYCPERGMDMKQRRFAWCNSYQERFYAKRSRFFVGRPINRVALLRDPVAKQMEKDYTAYRRKRLEDMRDGKGKGLQDADWWYKATAYDTADGSSEEGEHKEDQGGDACPRAGRADDA